MLRVFTRVGVIILILVICLLPTIVYASTPGPDSGPFVVSNTAYENTYQLGDILILVEYNIPYAALPSATATINYLIRYINPSGSVLQTVTPFSYQTLGYNFGVVAFYWAPSSGGPVWGEAGNIQIIGNPTVTWTGPTPVALGPMAANNWLTSSTVAIGRTQVCNGVLALAVDLENRWNVALTAQSSIGTILNASFGQQYFSNVISYFNIICSTILTASQAQVVQPPPTAPYATTYQASLQHIWLTSIIGPDIQASTAAQGISSDEWLLGTFLIISAAFILGVCTILQSPNGIPLMFIPVFVGGIKIGVVPMDLGVGICAVLFILSMYLLIYRHAAV